MAEPLKPDAVEYAPNPGATARRTNAADAQPGRWPIFLWGGLLVALLAAGFISLGLWQWNKYAVKTALQAELDERSRGPRVAMPTQPADVGKLRYRHVEFSGEYEAGRQILIDNRVDPVTERSGFHVLTPLKLAGSDMRVLINRGWVPAPIDRRVLPDVSPPAGLQHLSGIVVVPSGKYFALVAAGPVGSQWETVWQNLDLPRYATAAKVPVQPVVIQLDAAAPHGYARNWPRPDERADKHLSYALQWFGFCASTVGIWLYFLWRKPAAAT